MTLVKFGQKIKFPGDSIEVNTSMATENLSLAQAKEIIIKYSQYEANINYGLCIPTVDGSIISSLEKGYYKKPQQVIDLLKQYPSDYIILKKNFHDIFEDLKNEGFDI